MPLWVVVLILYFAHWSPQSSFTKLNSNPETRRLLKCHCSYYLRNTSTIGIPLYFNGYHNKNMIYIILISNLFFSLNIYTVSHFVCGGVAGCLSSTVAQPLDVIRTRLVAQGEPKVWLSLYSSLFFLVLILWIAMLVLRKPWFTIWKSWIPFIIVWNDHWKTNHFDEQGNMPIILEHFFYFMCKDIQDVIIFPAFRKE